MNKKIFSLDIYFQIMMVFTFQMTCTLFLDSCLPDVNIFYSAYTQQHIVLHHVHKVAADIIALHHPSSQRPEIRSDET